MKKLFACFAVVFIALCLCSASFAADNKKPEAPKVAPTHKPVQHPYTRPNMNILMGTITKINSADPKNVTIEVKDLSGGQARTVTVMPWTNVTKATDISELKAGDNVRIMSRQTEDNKETAMGIMFGKINPPHMMKKTPPAAKAAMKAPAGQQKKK